MGHCGSRPPSALPSQCLDPDGINPTSNPPFFAMPTVQPPSSFPMGGGSTHSFGALSPLTTSDTLAIWGNPSPPVTSSSSTWSSKSLLIFYIMGVVVPASSSDPTHLPAPTPNPFPPAIIKDKPSNIGLKDIVDKDSWLDTKEVINTQLHRSPYWPGPSTDLVITVDNTPASAWWVEVIAYYCKPPLSDLFIEESQFDGKGFEMIAYIDAYFNQSGAVDSLSYILNLIDIKQLTNKLVIML